MSNDRSAAITHNICSKRCAALNLYLNAKDQLEILGVKYKAADLIGMYEGFLESRTTVTRKRAELALAIAVNRDAVAHRKEIDNGLRGWVINKFGEGSTQAHEFGFAPKKGSRTKTAEEKAAAAKLRQSTREARGVIGSRKRAKITGTPPHHAPTASTAAPAALPASSPASAPAVAYAPAAVPARTSNGTSTNG